MDQYDLDILAKNEARPESERLPIKYEDIGPLVGVAVMVKHPRELGPHDIVLMGKRLGKHGRGTWSFPGGHVEFGETPRTAAVREAKEETDLDISEMDLQLVTVVSSMHEHSAQEYLASRFIRITRKHYLTVLYSLTYDQQKHGLPVNVEPEKTDGWYWVPFTNALAPRPLFQPILNFTGWQPIVGQSNT